LILASSAVLFGFQPKKSYPSGIPFKSDGYCLSIDNDRHFSCSLGVLQHGFEIPDHFYYIKILNLTAFFGKCCTSCPSVGSGILAENQYLIWHFSLLIVWWI
jgi:hypothetical protein